MAKKEKTRKLIQKYITILVGSAIFAAGLEFFLIPNNILDGGVVGISMILQNYIKVPLGLFIVLFNIPFLYLGYKQIGRRFTLASLVGIILMSVFTSLFHQYPPLINDPFLACIFGGIVLGLGVGLVIKAGGTLDGSEMFSIFATKKLPVSVGEMVLGINVIIFLIAGFVFSWESALYSMITYFIAAKVMDVTIEGINESKSVLVISSKYTEITQEISKELGRSSTLLHAEGAYRGEETKVVFCVITRLEESKLKELIYDIDENAFMSVGHVAEVTGANFKKRDIH